MKLNRFALLGAAAALAAVLLAGCGSSSSASSSAGAASAAPAQATAQSGQAAGVEAVFAPILAANPISNTFEITDMNLEYDYGIDPALVAAYQGVRSNDNGDAGCVLVLQAANEADVAGMVASLETYCDDQYAYWGNYAEFATAQDNVDNAAILSAGNTVVLAVASNECGDRAALAAAAQSALNS